MYSTSNWNDNKTECCVWITRIRGKHSSDAVIDAVDQATGLLLLLQLLQLLCSVFALNRSFADQHSKARHGASNYNAT